jgi:hypothetical protein
MTDLDVCNGSPRRLAAAAFTALGLVLAASEARAQEPAPPSSAPQPAPEAPKPAEAAAPAAPAAATPLVLPAEPVPAAPSAAAPAQPAPIKPAAPVPARTPNAEIVAEAPAQAEAEATPDDGEMGTHRDHWVGTIGLRTNFIPNEGFDPFETDDVLSQLTLGVGRTVYGEDKLAVAALVLWDLGGARADARSDEATLDVHRWTLAGEGRYHFFRRFYAFGRVAPGAIRWDASLEDDSVGYTREAGNWMFALDLSAGAAFEFAGQNRGKSTSPRGWVSVEGGYGWSTASEVSFESGDNEIPARVEPLTLNDLALRGGIFRIAANITY